MQMLTTEAAQAEIINKDFTSPETVLPLPSFGRSLQHLQQQTFWWWSIQSHPCEVLKIAAFTLLEIPSPGCMIVIAHILLSLFHNPYFGMKI